MPAPLHICQEEVDMMMRLSRAQIVICFFIIIMLMLSSCSSNDKEIPGYYLSKEHISNIISVITGYIFGNENAQKELKEIIDRGKQGEQNQDTLESTDNEVIFPKGPATYEGKIEEVGMTLVLDFQTSAVEGTLSLAGDDYARAEIVGQFDLKTLSLTGTYSGVKGSVQYGMEFPWTGAIEGKVSTDLGKLSGTLVDDEGEVFDYTLARTNQ
jgi:hypothetical protein